MKEIYLSVVIPVYNESDRLFRLKEVIDYLKKQKYSSEVIVVNDGSTDETLIKLKELAKTLSFQIVSYDQNRGKGWAIKKGMAAAVGEYRLFIDVDLSTPLKEIEKILPFLDKFPVVIGTRKNDQAKVLIHQPKLRENLGKAFTWLSQVILGVGVSDFTCGFKCFSKESADKIFKRMRIERWGFDSEILYLCQKFGYPIKEVAVVWKNDARSKVKFPQDIIRSLSELIQIISNDRIKHLYD